MRRYAIFGNWKMNKNLGEARTLAQQLKEALGDTGSPEVAVFPPAVTLAAVAEILRDTPVSVGTQNVHYESAGAFTGEMSAGMALSAGASCALIGHSERRHVFGETDEWVNLKLGAVLAAGLVGVVCIGETLEQREQGATQDIIKRQVRSAFEGIAIAHAGRIIVAYEPVWAIGTGKTATPEQAGEMHSFIRGLLSEQFDGETADAMRIQYGGSVKPGNAAELLAQVDIDGVLVGGASLDADSFCAIVGAGRQTGQ
jgi:triosephosphate isomerase